MSGGPLNVGGATWSNDGSLASTGGGVLSTSGSWTNAGDVDLDANGVLNATTGYTQTSAGHLYVDLAGTSQYSLVNVTGTTSLDGELHITVVLPFDPVPGDSFDVFNYSTHSGTFSNVSGAALGDGDTITLDYTDPDLTLDVN